MKTRSNPWPFAIITVFVLFISGTAGLVVLASFQRTELVSEDYYEQELRYQKRIDSIERAQQLASNADAVYDASAKCIRVTLPREHAGRSVTGRIQLYRPSSAGLDRHYALEPDAIGVQRIDAAALQRGLWRIHVSWSVDGKDYFSEQRINLPD